MFMQVDVIGYGIFCLKISSFSIHCMCLYYVDVVCICRRFVCTDDADTPKYICLKWAAAQRGSTMHNLVPNSNRDEKSNNNEAIEMTDYFNLSTSSLHNTIIHPDVPSPLFSTMFSTVQLLCICLEVVLSCGMKFQSRTTATVYTIIVCCDITS